jgi:hypothetical protein
MGVLSDKLNRQKDRILFLSLAGAPFHIVVFFFYQIQFFSPIFYEFLPLDALRLTFALKRKLDAVNSGVVCPYASLNLGLQSM